MTVFAEWRHRLHEIPAGGLRETRTATEAERAALANELPIVSCEVLVVEYQIKPAGRDRYALTGRLQAEVTQACVISLEPIKATLDEPLDCKFVAPTMIPDQQPEEQEALSVEDLEPIEDGTIDVGRIVFEVFSTSLDPYPRREDVEWQSPHAQADSEASAAGPFAALAELKKKT